MGFLIDPATIFLALLASTVAGALVLLWSFWLNRDEKSLLWIAVGFLIAGASNLLIAGRGTLPDWIAIQVGGAVLVFGVSFAWIAARVFNGRRVTPWVPVAGPVGWLIVCSVPAVFGSLDARVVMLSLICAVYYFVAAREVMVRDGLLTRLPLSVVLAVHGGFVLLRIPFILTDGEEGISLGLPWFGMATLEALVFIQMIAFLMVSLTKERIERQLSDVARTDPLTGLANRRAFFERADAAVAQASRSGAPLAVIVFDLDRFKGINDSHGHPVGDTVIQAFAATAAGRLRASDFIARFGGEEFAALLPDTNGDRASLVALQINQAFEAAVASMPHDGLTGTASAGVADLSVTSPSLEAILAAADRALYDAKANGRGQVRRAERSEPAKAMEPQAA